MRSGSILQRRARRRPERRTSSAARARTFRDMVSAPPARAPGFTITTESAATSTATGKPISRAWAPSRRGDGRDWPPDRARFWRCRNLCSSRCARAPAPRARHDGHGPQSRAERASVETLGEDIERRPFAYDSYRRFIQCIPTSCSTSRSQFRGHPRAIQRTARATRSTPT